MDGRTDRQTDRQTLDGSIASLTVRGVYPTAQLSHGQFVFFGGGNFFSIKNSILKKRMIYSSFAVMFFKGFVDSSS